VDPINIDLSVSPLNDEVKLFFAEITGNACCRRNVGEYRSLSLGFGEEIFELNRLPRGSFIGQWDVGTYTAAWRITKAGEILCGSMNLVDSIEELDAEVNAIEIGDFVGIQVLSDFDIRIRTSNGVDIEFLCVSTDDDEFFHVRRSDQTYVQFKQHAGWEIGISNEPWK
jgi:hypothetical protein